MGSVVREIVGWLLVVTSLGLVWIALQYVDNRQVVEAGAVMFAAVAILKAGILLVRVAAAARIVLRQDQSGGLSAERKPKS